MSTEQKNVSYFGKEISNDEQCSDLDEQCSDLDEQQLEAVRGGVDPIRVDPEILDLFLHDSVQITSLGRSKSAPPVLNTTQYTRKRKLVAISK